MAQRSSSFVRLLFGELDPVQLQRKLLGTLLELQHVERGSIWVKRENGYECIEAVGSQSERIKGLLIGAKRPSIVGWVIENGKMTIAEPGKDHRHYKEIEKDFEVKSKLILAFPLLHKSGQVYGAIQLIDTSAGGDRLNLREDYLALLQELIDIGSTALANCLAYADQVRENEKLRQALDAVRCDEVIVGRCESFMKALKIAGHYAASDFPVLITGESGTGKELIAREIHRLSTRRDKPFLVQNCSAIPDTLLESELFGYTKGAFTGATRDKIGLFEAANSGTVFLDEIGEMPLNLQAHILRVVQNGELRPLGSTAVRKVNVRIISATNKDLREAIAKQEFREDLFYRLNVLPIHLPSLRERREDIPLLLDYFLKREAVRMCTAPKTVAGDALRYLLDYPWRGNIRELENFAKYMMVVCPQEVITSADISLFLAEPASSAAPVAMPAQSSQDSGGGAPPGGDLFRGYTWDHLERDYILYLLEKNKWNISKAARDSGVNRSTFDSRMKKLGVRKRAE